MSTSRISVRVRAGARREAVDGARDGVLLVPVAAPAHEGVQTARCVVCWPGAAGR